MFARIFFLLTALLAEGDMLSVTSLAFELPMIEFVCGVGGGADDGGGTFENLPKLLKDFCLRAVGDRQRRGETELK